MDKILLFFALKYNGDWDAIYEALDRKETIDFKQLENIENKFKCKYTTVLNPLYPNSLKAIYKPPFVLFYIGGINDINTCENILAVSSTGLNKENVKFLDNDTKVVGVCNNGIDESYKYFRNLFENLKINNPLIISQHPHSVGDGFEKSVIESCSRIINGLNEMEERR